MSPCSDDWPRGQHIVRCPSEHVHAIGMVALNFNLMEETVRRILVQQINVPPKAAEKIAGGMTNRERVDTLLAIIESDQHGDEVICVVRAALHAFDICTDNRNILMHSNHLYSDVASGVTSLFKRSRGDKSKGLIFDVNISDLREVADVTNDTINMLLDLWMYFETRLPLERRFPDDFMDVSTSPPSPLPREIPKPRKLNLPRS